MKKPKFAVVWFLANLLSVASAFGQVEKTFTQTQNDLIFTRERGIYDLVSLKQGICMHEIGKPMMPIRMIQLIVPEYTKITGVTVVSFNSITLGDNYYIYPAQAPLKSGGDSSWHFVPPDSTTYNSNLPFPGKIAEFISEGYTKEAHIVTIFLYPVQWTPSLRRLSLITNVRLRVELSSNSIRGLEAKRRSNKDQVEFEYLLGKILDNPEDIGTYLRRPALIQGLGKKVEKPIITSLPSMQGLPVEYVVITSRGDSSSWQSLVDWKFSKGVPATIRTLEWIYDHYSGCDQQEKIRNFIKDAYCYWGTEWVLLGKDTDTIPDRILYYTPSDYYYCALDGNFNANGNNIFGESGIPPYGDNPDYGWDLSVGRVPVHNLNDVTNYISKVMQYEDIQSQDVPYVQKLLFLGAKAWCACYGQIYQDDIINNVQGIPATWYKKSLYSRWCWSGDPLQPSTAITEMNNGYNIIDHIDHCNPYLMGTDCNPADDDPNCQGQWGSGGLTREDFSSLQSPWKASILYSIGCWPSAIDWDCVAERFILNPNGGGMAFIGNTHDGYFVQPGNRQFYVNLFTNQIYHLGRLLETTRPVERPMGDDYFYELTLLGDPETPVWSNTPENLTVYHPALIPMGQQSFGVTVYDNQSPRAPVEGATVCLMKKNSSGEIEAWACGSTNASGQVTFTYTPETEGNLSVTVVGHNSNSPYANYIPYHGTCSVQELAVQPYVFPALNGRTFNDAPPNGNGDGKPNPGETINLLVGLTNSGNQDATNVSAQISTTDPFVTISQGIASYGTIPQGQTVTNVLPYTFSNAIFCPDVHDAQIGITVTANGGYQWQDKFIITILCDTLMLVSHGHLDMTPGSKTLDSVKIFNNGSGLSSGVSATLSFAGTGVTIINNTINYPNIPAGSTKMSGAFTYTVAGSPSGHFECTMSDQFNRTWMKRIAFSNADDSVHTPSRASFIPGQKEVDLSWSADSRDLRDPYTFLSGFHVYRSQSYAGPFTLMDSLIRGTSAYRDTFGVLPGQQYYYKISSVDTSLNESPLSDTASIVTNAPLGSAWPKKIWGNGVSSSSPVVGDINGDGQRELIIGGGDDSVHAWHADGNSISGWPVYVGQNVSHTPALGDLSGHHNGTVDIAVVSGGQTQQNQYVDVYTGAGNRILHLYAGGDAISTSPTLADVDGDGQLEILVGTTVSQGTSHIYIWKQDGSVLPGWGQNMVPPIDPVNGIAVGNVLNTNNQLQIFATTSYYNSTYLYWDNKLYGWNSTGNGLSGWYPQDLSKEWQGNNIFARPALGDVDRDGNLEVIGFKYSYSTGYQITVWNGNGVEKTNWPKSLIGAPWNSVGLGDFQMTGYLNILTSLYYSEIDAFDYQGNELSNWPKNTNSNMYGCPVIANALGGGTRETFVQINDHLVFGFNLDGSLLPGWPLQQAGYCNVTPCLVDLDNDGQTEMISASGDGWVYVWKLGTPFDREHLEWGQDGHDARHTYLYSQIVPAGTLPASTTWRGNIEVTGNVTVPLMGNLTIEPGTVIKFRMGTAGPCKLIVNGLLNAVGTSLDSIYFTSASPNPAPNDWYGIDVMGTGTANLSYCAVRYGYNNITGESGSHVTVSYSRITNAAAAGIVLRNGTHNVTTTAIWNNALFGINIWGPWGGNATIQSDTIVNNTVTPTYGIYAHYNINSGTLNINSNTISYATMPPNMSLYGIECDTVTNVAKLYGNSITGYGQGGIRIYRASPKCTCNVVNNCLTYGLYFYNGSSVVTHNTVSNVNIGAYVTGPAGSSTVPNLGNGSAGTNGQNSITSTSSYRGYNAYPPSGPTVQAQYNYWGSSPTWYGKWNHNNPLPSPPGSCGNPPGGGPQESELLEQLLPRIFALAQSYPNPSTGELTIRYQLPKACPVALKVYNVSGQIVRTLVSETQKPGYYGKGWDGKDEFGHAVRSGVYFYRMEAGDFRFIRKLVIVR